MDYGVSDCLAQNLLGISSESTRETPWTVEVRRKFLATAATASEIISPNVPSQIVRSMNSATPQLPLSSHVDSHINEELGIELLRVTARGKEAGLGNIALEVEEIQTLHLCLLVRRTAHRSRRQRIGTLYRAVDQRLVEIAHNSRAGHRIAIARLVRSYDDSAKTSVDESGTSLSSMRL